MSSSRIVVSLCLAAGLGAPLWLGQNHPAEAQAPGSPAAINAADHPDLQSAFNALPEEGGVVRIPPGNYDISEPLVLSKPETRVEGSARRHTSAIETKRASRR